MEDDNDKDDDDGGCHQSPPGLRPVDHSVNGAKKDSDQHCFLPPVVHLHAKTWHPI